MTAKCFHVRLVAFLSILTLSIILIAPASAREYVSARVEGSWYLALDAQPFGLPPGATLPGLVQFHTDHTMTILDAGDLGALPFPTRDTAQLGNWTYRRDDIRAMTFFLQVDASTGQATGWNLVKFELDRPQNNIIQGLVNTYYLPCDPNVPFTVFFCPNPVTDLDDFIALPPADIPVTLTRLPVP